jgi:hypothetical protein
MTPGDASHLRLSRDHLEECRRIEQPELVEARGVHRQGWVVQQHQCMPVAMGRKRRLEAVEFL